MARRRSGLDKNADWLILRANQPTRKIAADYNAAFGTKYTHKAIAQWFQKRNAPQIVMAETLAERVTKVTKDVLEGEWVRQLNEVRENYTKAKEKGDTKAMAEWNRQAQFQVSMLLKAWQPSVVLQNVSEVITEKVGAKAQWIREVIESIQDNDLRQRLLALL